MFLRTHSPGTARLRPALEALDERVVPAVIAVDDSYSVARGAVLTVDAKIGVLSNDFSTTDPGAVFSAAQFGAVRYVGSTQPLPANTLSLNPNGSFTFIAPASIPAGVSQITFQYQATNLFPSSGVDPSGVGTVTINVIGAGNTRLLATGAGAGGGPEVKAFDVVSGFAKFSFFAYERSFTGGVRVAVADMNQDGIDDIITAPGSGGSALVKVFNGRDGSLLFQQNFFEASFRGGAYIAAGDVDGDGRNDLIVGAGEGGGSRVVVVQPDIGGFGASTVIADFFAYESTYRNGAKVAAGDVDGIGRDFVITAPGAGGGPRVNEFDINVVVTGNAAPVRSFYANSPSDRGGLNIATGNLTADGNADIIVGTASGTGTVTVFDGTSLALLKTFNVPTIEVPNNGGLRTGPNASYLNPLTNLPSGTLIAPTGSATALVDTGLTFAGGLAGGVTVAAVDWDGDGFDDIVTGAGPAAQPLVKVFRTSDNEEIANILAYGESFLGGVFVGASD